jgi:hypothetical protein
MYRLLFALMMAVGLVFPGCSKSGPPPLTLEEIPAAITAAFKTGKLQPKKNAEAIAKLISEKQYAIASIQLQALLSNPDLTPEQREVLSSSFRTVSETLQAQVASVDPGAAPAEGGSPKPPPQPVTREEAAAAAAAIEHYRATK